MSENFISATTQIGDLVRKRLQIIEKVAGLLADVIIGRMKDGNLTRSNEKDIKNSIKDFSAEEQVDILVKALVITGMNSSSNTSSFNDNDDYPAKKNKKGNRSDLFSSRW